MLPLPTTQASLAAVCQQGRWMVAWQLGPHSANQDRVQQDFSPWHIKERNRLVLHFNWFRFSAILFKGKRDAESYSRARDSVDMSELLRRTFPSKLALVTFRKWPALSQTEQRKLWSHLLLQSPKEWEMQGNPARRPVRGCRLFETEVEILCPAGQQSKTHSEPQFDGLGQSYANMSQNQQMKVLKCHFLKLI